MDSIQRVSITDKVIQNLKELITSGKLAVGDKMPTEQSICSMLNVSRSTVREALRVLQAMGFIEIKPGKGAFVARTSENVDSDIIQWFAKNEIRYMDFIEVRMAIEPLTVKLAIQRATDKEILELEKIHSEFEKAIEEKDVLKLLMIDEAFHSHIAACTKNKLLIDISNKILRAFTEYRSRSFAYAEIYANALEPHRKILQAVKERNIVNATSAMIEHINITLEDMTRVAHKYRIG